MEIRIKYNHPIEVTLDVVCGKWKGVILCLLMDQTLRFGELKKEIPAITQKMLTQQLRELEEDQLVNRVAYNEIPPRVEYSLTAYGEDLKPALEMLKEWGNNHINVVAESKLEQKLGDLQEADD
ncbi:winged helix-turn-helix transcriptional regulator [Lentibacillus halophilus]|uniref:Winged helix-turn-helix transcriptional regulator n=1 Tax=Lentibacillus halophilus TaxID=295065 RepID=A0ABN0ZA11_9BACI